MNLNPLYELKERLESGIIAGVSLLSEDFRLARAVEQIEPLSKASPVFQKIYQSAMQLLSDEGDRKGDMLLDILGFVDAVLTTREMCRLFRSDCIVPADLEEAEFDSPLGSGTGAAVIFGATGGVMDAALRSAYYLVTGRNPDPDAFQAVRGSKPWREAVFHIPGAGDVRVAAVSGLANTRKLMEAIDSGDAEYDFVEVMACPGGCSGGGGQPIVDGEELAEYRGDALWDMDKQEKVRFSHENSDIQALYRDYMEKPCGERAHHLLHTDHSAWQMPPAPVRLR